MEKILITFGQQHTHRVNGITFDCDSVAVIEAENHKEGREKAFELFGDKFFTSYLEETFQRKHLIVYFPRGLINVEEGA